MAATALRNIINAKISMFMAVLYAVREFMDTRGPATIVAFTWTGSVTAAADQHGALEAAGE